MLLRSLVSGFARDVARQSLEDAVKRRATDAEPDETPCDCLVIFALSVESGGLVDMLDDFTTTRAPSFVEHAGRLEGRRVVVVNSGVGRDAARVAAADAIRVHRPAWVISAGFAGGLVDPLRRGHFVLANEVVDPEGNQIAIPLPVEETSLESDKRLHSGRLATVDAIVATEDAKRALGEASGAIACDMETSAVAQACAEQGTRLLSVRIISDAVDDQLPPEVATLLAQKTWASKLGAATGALFKRPSSALDMWQHKEDALKATDRLAKFLRGTIGQLPPAS